MCWTGFGWESWFMHAEVLQSMVRLYSSTLFSCENISFLCSLCHILFGFLMIWAPQSSRRKSYIEITSDTETCRMSPRWKSISSLANTWELLVKTNFRYVPCLHYRIARTNAFFLEHTTTCTNTSAALRSFQMMPRTLCCLPVAMTCYVCWTRWMGI